MSLKRMLRILLVDDEEIVFQTVGDYLRDSGHEVDEARDGASAAEQIETHDYDLALVDVRMPGMDGLTLLEKVQGIRPELPIVIITGHGNMEIVIQALRLGAADFLTKPIKFLELDAMLEKSVQIRTLRQDRRRLRETIRGIQVSSDLRRRNRILIGLSPAIRTVREQIRQVVESGCDTVLITGETGTGKELVARTIHFQSGSDEAPFIPVSCPALPESLAESELFGHVRGAFTGADSDRAGYFELADGGTLFLDEVADLSHSLQAKLLRVLETRAFRRVGGAEEVDVSLRIIAATNAPLRELVETEGFRLDLFYRLNVYSIHLSPLQERRADILPLSEHFLSTYARSNGLQFDGFSLEAEEVLLNHDYPGNARELRHLIECAAIVCGSGRIQAEHLPMPKRSEDDLPSRAIQPDADPERTRILRTLEELKWNRRQAAETLNMSYSTLRRRMKKLNIGQ